MQSITNKKCTLLSFLSFFFFLHFSFYVCLPKLFMAAKQKELEGGEGSRTESLLQFYDKF